ncbi:MAG TPA: gamma-glutamyltransferase family protein [Candidatus Dormibacteraeota bacterium]|nr:gamma-glutamyltransferase family protein [Candidatus Dormibacteraeota bacterium]
MTFTTRPLLQGTFGMVSSTHWLASQCGMSVLERGGNAFDAAVAAGFVLQVVEPHLNGLGGEVPIIAYDAASKKVEVICGQGPAPHDASIDRIRALGLDEIPGSGPLAACVPGAFGGWMTLLRDHGTWRVRDVLEAAIGYADAGFPMLERASQMIATVEPLFREHWPSSAAVYLAGGVPRPGALFKNGDLAATYRRLVDEASGAAREAEIDGALRAYYSGFVAEAVEQHCQRPAMDSSGEAHAGLLRGADLERFEPAREAALTAEFGEWAVAKCGPWSQGPVFLQQLRLLEGFHLDRVSFLSSEHVHLVTECAKLAFADREAWYGDPDFVTVPIDELLSRDYAQARRGLIADSASLELRPGSPGGATPRLPRRGAAAVSESHWTGSGAQAAGDIRRDTVHVSVADRHGNLVACTPSGGWLQSSPVITGLGFCLGTRAQMFNLDPEHPNRVEPGKRPRTTLSPSLAMRDGEPCLAFGTPGGDQQDQWTLEFFVAHAVFGLDLQAAMDAPMFHTTHFPSSFVPHDAHPGEVHIERLDDDGVLRDLTRRGHRLRVGDRWSLGRMCAVARDPSTGLLSAAANPRGAQAYAAGR